MDLRSCAVGAGVSVQALAVGPADASRLGALGLRVGTVVHVVNRGAAGATVLALGSDRLALDGATCAAIDVAPLAASTSTSTSVPA